MFINLDVNKFGVEGIQLGAWHWIKCRFNPMAKNHNVYSFNIRKMEFSFYGFYYICG